MLRQDTIRLNFSRAVVRAGVTAIVVALLGGCAAQQGDFGRPVKNYVQDTIHPAVGKMLARDRGEPVSSFMLTDDEKELRRRSYRFIMPIHRDPFFARNGIEWVRTRIWPDSRYRPDPTLYYRMMRKDDYQSNYGRWNNILDEVTADIPLIQPYYVVWQEVCRADLQRLEALPRTVALTVEESADAEARVWENRRVAVWAVTGMRWRIESYAYAIQRSEIEIPSSREQETDLALARMTDEVDWLESAIDDPTCGGAAPVYYEPMVVKR